MARRVVRGDREISGACSQATLAGRPESRRYDEDRGARHRRIRSGARRAGRWYALPSIQHCRLARWPFRSARSTNTLICPARQCNRHSSIFSRKAPLRHHLGKRPRSPLQQRQRLRLLFGSVGRRRLPARAGREKMVERWLRAWTQKSSRVAGPGCPIFRSGPTTPSCVRCRKCSRRLRSPRSTF